MANVLDGRIVGIVLTGGLANVKLLTDWIRGRFHSSPPSSSFRRGRNGTLAEGGLRVNAEGRKT
jgi:butyrate kinase